MMMVTIYERNTMKVLEVFTSETEAQAYCARLGHGEYLSRTSFMYMDETIDVEFDIK